ncbi:MAG TPA: acyclic terpene utilization AtuA family protein [Caulobacteraceae bacterium]|nr:acyclic terpene utilization AtuA family protein [Caulobacteraceae bacterium]
MDPEIRYVAATGAVGAGVDSGALERALEIEPHFIAADAGTTDAGPYYLGAGEAAYPREAVKRDLTLILAAGTKARIPVLIGSAGTAGADVHVDQVFGIAREIAAEFDLELPTAVIRSEQDKDYLCELMRAGRIRPLEAAPNADERTIRESARIVGMMGVEPLQKALVQGAQFILAGRCSDSALYAAMPILRGFPAGLAWHAGKVAECGTMACEGARRGVLTATIRAREALLRPVGEGLRCTPQSVAAHSLYENAHPYLHQECAGVLDLTDTVFEAVDDRTVRLAGSRFTPSGEYTVKLEGAALVGCQSIMVGGIRDPYVLRRFDTWLAEVREIIERAVARTLGLGAGDWTLIFHVYGKDAVMGALEPRADHIGHEVGIVVEATCATQDLATKAMQLARQPFLHHGVPEWLGGVTSFACLHNPAHVDRGPVYHFNLNHVALPGSPDEMFRTELLTLGGGR